MAQPFAAHQGAMPGHPGVAHGGHPMAPGHPSNQGVPGGVQQPVVSMAQMHPGASGPGVAQVSQAGPMMVGMPHGVGGVPGVSTGGGPSAHALSHLNPGNPQQIFQQQQMQQARKLVSYILWKSRVVCLYSYIPPTPSYLTASFRGASNGAMQLIPSYLLCWPYSSGLYTSITSTNFKSLLVIDINHVLKLVELYHSRFGLGYRFTRSISVIFYVALGISVLYGSSAQII